MRLFSMYIQNIFPLLKMFTVTVAPLNSFDKGLILIGSIVTTAATINRLLGLINKRWLK